MQSILPRSEAVILGMVIAGGRSLRFGGEKAVAPFRDRPLLSWAVERLQSVCAEVAVNARPGTAAAALAAEHGWVVLHDQPGDPDGPLSGIRAGLAWASARGARWLAVSPCDVPLAPRDLFERLAATGSAAMAETAEGRQPLCAIWPVSALPVVTAALAGGAHPPTWRVLESTGAVKVRFDAAECFANANTREELQRLEALAAGGPQGRATSDTDRR